MEKITAIIPTYNEEKNIKEAIESVLWCDEIIVVDSYSTDKTVRIATSFPKVRLLQNKFKYFADQKNWTIPQAKHEWIFLLDADERTTPALIKEIQSILQNGTQISAYWIYRINHFMGKRVNYSGWQSDKVIRFFRRDECCYKDVLVHEEIETKGQVSILKNKLIHYTYSDLTTYLAKADKYTTAAAIERFKKFQKEGRKVGGAYILTRSIGRFLRHYFLRYGILDGTQGVIVSCLSAYNVFIRGLKILALQNGEKLEDPFKK